MLKKKDIKEEQQNIPRNNIRYSNDIGSAHLPRGSVDLTGESAQQQFWQTPVQQLYARPCPDPSLLYHVNCWRSLSDNENRSSVESCRLRYHSKMIEATVSGGQVGPLVSIIITCYNESREVLYNCVRSALMQTYQSCEVILIDDGADVPVQEMIPEFTDRVKILRQSNQGVPVARNRGMFAAKGEFIHYLDADDILDPECISEKINVFYTVPDTKVCFSLYRCRGDNGVKSANNHTAPSIGDHYCPSRCLLTTVLKRFPFQISSMMMPRWVVLDVGPFESDLKQSQDNRQWFKLAVRGTKVAGIKRELNTRYFRKGSLTSRKTESIYYSFLSYCRNFLELCCDPMSWPAIPAYLPRFLVADRFQVLNHSSDREVNLLRDDLLNSFNQFRETQELSGFSMAPLLEGIRQQLFNIKCQNPPLDRSEFWNELMKLLDTLDGHSHQATERDLELWLKHPAIINFPERAYSSIRCLSRTLNHGQITIEKQNQGDWEKLIQELLNLSKAEREANISSELPPLAPSDGSMESLHL